MESNEIYREEFKIRANEVGNNGKLTIPALCGLFQEIAGNHALVLNFDITHLQENGFTWVLHRMDIQVNTLPNWRETITIETWPAAGDALRAYRNYIVINSKGEVLISCLSYWMMINMKTRRPTRMPQEILNTRLADRKNVLEVQSSKIPAFDDPETSKNISVRRADLDMNEHVNNVRYLEWMEEPLNTGQISLIKKVDVIFMREALLGDTINTEVFSPSSSETQHQLLNQKGELVAQAKFSFSL